MQIRLSKVMANLSEARLRALAVELGVSGLEDAPADAVVDILIDRLRDRQDGEEWLMQRVDRESTERGHTDLG